MAEQDPAFALDLEEESLRHGAGVFGHSHELQGLESLPVQHNTLADDLQSPEQDGGQMNSLAFELAQASPTGGAPSSLAAELGLEEADHDPDFDDALSASDQQQQQYMSDREEEEEEQQKHEPGTPTRHQTTPVKLRSSASKATLRHSPSFRLQTSPQPAKPSSATLDHIDFDKLDADLASSTQAIHADLQAMSSFLSSLSTYTSDVPSTIEPQGKTADRQLFIERLTSDVIRSMYSMSKERDSQLRELHDLSRQANKSEPDWIEALSELEPLPVVDWQLFTAPSSSFAAAAASTSSASQNQLDSIGEEPEDSSSSISTNLYPTSSLTTPSATEPSSPLLETISSTTKVQSSSSPLLHSDMSTLRRQTSDVISSLSGINEHIQVHRAGLNESGRKLKSLKAALTNIKAEADTVHQCIDFVNGWEALHYPPDLQQQQQQTEEVTGQFARHAKEEMDAAKDLLDAAGKRAQSMLRDPA